MTCCSPVFWIVYIISLSGKEGIFFIWVTSSEGSSWYIDPLRVVVNQLGYFCGYLLSYGLPLSSGPGACANITTFTHMLDFEPNLRPQTELLCMCRWNNVWACAQPSPIATANITNYLIIQTEALPFERLTFQLELAIDWHAKPLGHHGWLGRKVIYEENNTKFWLFEKITHFKHLNIARVGHF